MTDDNLPTRPWRVIPRPTPIASRTWCKARPDRVFTGGGPRLPVPRSWGRLGLVTGPHEADQPLGEPHPYEGRGQARTLVTPKRVLNALILALVLTFVAQNGASAHMHFLGLTFSLPLGVALVISAIVGAVVALVVTAAARRRARGRDRRH